MKKTSQTGTVFLVGAGPGDPELITLRGMKSLQKADVVLYDALVHPALLKNCAPHTELIFVGKRAGKPSERQNRIHQYMLDYAKAGKTVVRLKGGDPFLFGRGSEEAEHLAEHHIPFEVVPGIASPLAAAAYTGISLSHRKLSSSIAYITATESPEKDQSSHPWEKLATATETLVIFMGMRKLDELMKLLIHHGRAPQTPAAVVQSASLPEQKTVLGTISNIAQKAKEKGLGLPALTIVGNAVNLHQTLRWFDTKPLFGKRILVTRPKHQTSSLEQLLRDAAAEPIVFPTIEIAPSSNPKPLAQALEKLHTYAWIVFTSHNGVASFFRELKKAKLDTRALGHIKVAVIGAKTEASLLEQGIQANVVPSNFRGEDLAAAIIESTPLAERNCKVLIPRAKEAREILPQMLKEEGFEVDVVEAYETKSLCSEKQKELRELFEQNKIDIVTFTSSSTVTHLLEALGPDAKELLSSVHIASIGPITTETAKNAGIAVDVTADPFTIESLVKHLQNHFS